MGKGKRFRNLYAGKYRYEHLITRKLTVKENTRSFPKYNETDLVIKDFCYQCPEDSAGVPLKDGGCQCMCTHFIKEPLLKGRPCRRRTVTMVPNSPGIPINVIMDRRNWSFQSGNQNASSEISISQTLNITLIFSLILASLLIFVLLVIYLLRTHSLKCFDAVKNKSQLEMKATSRPGQLQSERLINNPTYDPTCFDLAIRNYPPEEVHLLTQIGQGCFGKVFKGEVNGEIVAVKIVRREHAAEAVREIETMASFSHPNILPILGTTSSPGANSPWLLFEYMEHGDLASLLRRSPFSPTGKSALDSSVTTNEEEDAASTSQFHLSPILLPRVAQQIAEGMKYLSSQHFVHRDLAARNCLVSANCVVKISDFGLSKDVYTCDYYKIGSSKLLPVRWMSPESILYGFCTLESDVWAFGTLLWEMYTWGKQPYYGKTNEEAMQLILNGELLKPPSDCPPLIRDIMTGCWAEVKDRLTFAQICDILEKADEISEEYEDVGAAQQMEEPEYEILGMANQDEYFEVV